MHLNSNEECFIYPQSNAYIQKDSKFLGADT